MKRSRPLSDHARKVLTALLEAQGEWCHGYELCRLTDVKSGTLYPLLIRLESKGYLKAEWQPSQESGRPPRHAYRLTASGRALALENPPAPVRKSAGAGRTAPA